jgi:hypothetical protein
MKKLWAPGGVYDVMFQELWAPGGACRLMVQDCVEINQ